MGSTVCQAVAADPDLELVAALDPHHAGLDLRQLTGVDKPLQIAMSSEAFVDAGVDVAVDFTHVEAGREILRWLGSHGIHAVTGTTGFTDTDYDVFGRVFT